MNVPQIPDTAPFNAEQRAWLNGYLAALLGATESQPVAASAIPLAILYGSQTGTAEMLAHACAQKAAGFSCKVSSLADFSMEDFSACERVLILTSTYGDGDFPDNAQAFWDALVAKRPALSQLQYSVLALGDRNYEQFCEAGKRIDKLLTELGAMRVCERVDCDTDYEAPSEEWMKTALSAFVPATGAARITVNQEAPAIPDKAGAPKKEFFAASLSVNRMLTSEGSGKETRHFEISLQGSGLTYQAGDALAVRPRNCADFVQEILSAANLDGEEAVCVDGEGEISLRRALTDHCELKPFLTALPPAGIAAKELVAPLRKLQPRLYSISSSPCAHGNSVHLTVAIVRYETHGKARKGACSTFLADRVPLDGPVQVSIHASPGFKLPADPAMPIIMVGPGTGIAPFRGFLHERRAAGCTGKNWLFFGEQRSRHNFYYHEELQEFIREDRLRLDTAFSRDQEEKVYVQHRMLENAAELWKWLQDGASFYVCGDASRMAKDVDAALRQVAIDAGGLSDEASAEFLQQLRKEKRYLRDVY